MKKCCENKSYETHGTNKTNNGFLHGILYGLLPHSFCIAFILFSVIGATAATTIFKSLLLIPNFFQILIAISFIFAAISAAIYLRRKNKLSLGGIRENKGYLGILFGTTIAVNLLLFLVIFPAVANRGTVRGVGEIRYIGEIKTINLAVKIPCSGHASLIIGEIRKVGGVRDVSFSLPNVFTVSFDPQETNQEEILQLPIFKSFPAVLR